MYRSARRSQVSLKDNAKVCIDYGVGKVSRIGDRKSPAIFVTTDLLSLELHARRVRSHAHACFFLDRSLYSQGKSYGLKRQ